MALTDENNMIMPVAPMNNGFGGGFGNNGDGWWILLLFLLIGGNGWGNGFGGFGGNDGLYPWMNQAEITSNGFANLSTQNQINSIQSDLGDIQTQLCNGFSGVNATVSNGFAQAEISDNARQMANMQQSFNSQTAITSAINGLGTQFADCCCENRLANCQTQNLIQNEGNATRFADANNTRDILTSITSGIQSIKDEICADSIESKNDRIADLERQLTLANLSASQNLQTQTLLADNFAQTNALEQYLAPVPRPAYIVQNPNCCSQNTCGCGNY